MGKTELRLEIDATLVEQARAAEVQMALLLERALKSALGDEAAEERARRWAEENTRSIEAHNSFVDEHGAFGAEWRSW
jgi:antitoxin CcdA